MKTSIRETFELAHKLLQCCIDSMEAFGGYVHRIRFAEDYGDGAVPCACHSPEDLFNHWQRLKAVLDSLEISYYHAPRTDQDITRALSTNSVQVPAMLNVEADTHIEAVCMIAQRIQSALNSVCDGSLLPYSYEEADERSGFYGETCREAAERVREYAHDGPVASYTLSYLRRGVFAEEEVCRRFFDPDGSVAAPKGKPGRKEDEVKTGHALKANELRSKIPQPTWAEVARAINREFTLIGADRYDDFNLKPENSIREIWRLRHGDKSQKKGRD